MCDHKTQELVSANPESTFFLVEAHVVFAELFKDLFQVCHVLGYALRFDNHVIDLDLDVSSNLSPGCSSNPNSGSVCSLVGISPTISINTMLMSYTRMHACSLGSHLTCWESIPALSVITSPSVLSPTRYHRRKGRWEKNDTKLLEKKRTNSSMPTSSEKLDIPLSLPMSSWQKRPTTNGECAPTILI